MHNIYNKPQNPPLKIYTNILRKILLSCTTEVSFYDYHGNIYKQQDSIAIEFALEPTFSNFYKAHLENKHFQLLK